MKTTTTQRILASSVTVTALRAAVTLLAIGGCMPDPEIGADGPDAGATGGSGSGSGSGTSVDAGVVNNTPFPLDCAVTENQMTPNCARPSTLPLMSIGSGPPINGKLNSGFVDGNRLIAGVAYSNSPATGYIVAVDLTNGERTIVSGYYNDVATGRVMTGAGGDWGTVHDVQPGPDGWYAITSVGVYRVDPATGARTQVISHANTATRCTVGTMKAIPRTSTFAVGPDKSIYLSLSNNPASSGVGLVAVKAGVCRIVSLGGGPTGTAVGSGATMTSGYFQRIRFRDGKVWALEFLTQSLMTVDPANGARVRLSSSGTTALGTGDIDVGTAALAFPMTSTNPVYTTFYDTLNRQLHVPVIDPNTGNRKEVPLKSGPANKGGAEYPPLWMHPTKEWVIVGLDDSIVQIDIATGSSYTLSR